MFMIHEDVKVGLITDHVPIADLSKHINSKLIAIHNTYLF